MRSKSESKPKSLPMEGVHGNPGEWDHIWSDLDENKQSMFVRDSPKTILQLWQKYYFEDLFHMFGPVEPGEKFLELGAGRGTTSLYLADKGCDVTLVDLSTTGLEMARRNFLAAGVKEPQVVCADATDTGLPSGKYSCVFNIGLLEHFEDPTAILAESHRLLKPGGLLFSVIVPSNPYPKRWLASILLAPWQVPVWHIKSLIKKLIGWQGNQVRSEMIRTDYDGDYYLNCAESLGWKRLECVPYNAYHTLFNLKDPWHVLSAYKLHYGTKKFYPKLKTSKAISVCDLLIATK